ncbi:MAG: acyltransferase family protein [Bacteroidaceae bacterium]|nr:acyltransferase family protein [Bacteroidaceae bacterium]
MEKKRVEFIDLAKGFCIILVVFNHIHKGFDAPYMLADSFKMFRMPLYFFLSGLFFKRYEGFGGFMKRKTNKLLIPFAFFFLLTSFLVPNIILYLTQSLFKLRLLWSFFYPEFFPNFPIWFLLCLFEMNIIFYLIYLIAGKCKNHEILVMTILSGIIGYVGYYLGHNQLNLYMFLDTAMSALPFFYVGFITRKYTTILQANRIDKFNIPIACVLMLITYLFACHIDYSTNNFIQVSFLRVYGCGLAGVFAVIFISKAIKKLPYISYLGRYSIMLLCTHFIIVSYLNPRLKSFISSDWVAIFVSLTITLALYAVIIPFMKRFMPHVTAQKDVINIK